MLYYTVIHPLGDDLQLGISLNIFVLFVFFVDQMIFLGLRVFFLPKRTPEFNPDEQFCA